MSESSFPKATREHAARRRVLTPEQEEAFQAFSKAVFAEGALDGRTKQLIAVAVAHVTQCPWCIEGYVKAARRAGARRGDHGGGLGRRRDARRRRLRAWVKTIDVMGNYVGG